MDREIIREESEEPGRCITANKLLCKLGEESNYTGHVEDWNLHKQKVVLKVGTMIDKKTTSKANSNSQLANAQASKQKQPIEMDAKQKRNYALKNFEYDSSSFRLSSLSKWIRMRQWGKWAAEIREPKKRSRIGLGSYSSPVAAARAYDTAVFYRRDPSARLNFPKLFAGEAMSAASIRKKATEVGAQVDAVETALHHPHPHHQHQHQQQQQHRSSTAKMEFKTTCGRFVDLNKVPDPENSDPSGRGTRLKRKTS